MSELKLSRLSKHLCLIFSWVVNQDIVLSVIHTSYQLSEMKRWLGPLQPLSIHRFAQLLFFHCSSTVPVCHASNARLAEDFFQQEPAFYSTFFYFEFSQKWWLRNLPHHISITLSNSISSMPANTHAPFLRPYDNGVNFQRFSKELVIYSPLVEQFVTIAWWVFQRMYHILISQISVIKAINQWNTYCSQWHPWLASLA